MANWILVIIHYCWIQADNVDVPAFLIFCFEVIKQLDWLASPTKETISDFRWFYKIFFMQLCVLHVCIIIKLVLPDCFYIKPSFSYCLIYTQCIFISSYMYSFEVLFTVRSL